MPAAAGSGVVLTIRTTMVEAEQLRNLVPGGL
jgi:hypothetical protein